MGANASGKTALALALAKAVNGEIISADSKQIYQRLSAGTSKPLGQWTSLPGRENIYLVEGIPYHLLDTVDPKATYDAGAFAKDAKRLSDEIIAAGKTPIIAGGTGMYIQALWNGLDPLPAADQELRKELTAFADAKGREALHKQLADLDPKAAEKIPHNNIQRVVRAIEISKLAGRPASELWSGRFFDSLPDKLGKFIFLKWEKELLTERIKKRTIEVFDLWVRETKELLISGYPEDAPGLKSLGYPQVLDFLAGRADKHTTIHAIVTLSMSYAKRQNTWFQRYKNATKFEFTKPEDYSVKALAEKILQ